MAEPLLLRANTLASFYSGGGRIARFRRDPGVPATDPEDWVGSDTARTGQSPRGLTVLPDGTLLRDLFAAAPESWFGPGKGARSGVLVKLLDAGQRLPLHYHPSRSFAQEHLSDTYGKTEAWIVLDAEPDAAVHVGFARDVTAAELTGWVTDQDVDAMLAACNRVPVRTGDVLLCPAGVPHAIGAGLLVAELQEPTDFSLMLEWRDFPIPAADVHLGLDREVALSAVHRAAVTPADLTGHRLDAEPGVTPLMPSAADAFFHADQIVPAPGGTQLSPAFAVLMITSGAGRLGGVEVSAGQTWLIPYASGPLTITGDLTAIRCRPA